MKFPRMVLIQQTFPRPQVHSIETVVQNPIRENSEYRNNLQGKRIAVAVGSRGIADLSKIVGAGISVLKELGADPFIFPAMGSHGGATPEGQIHILADYGITEKTMGVPVNASMETIRLGETDEGIPIFVSRTAWEANGIVIVNRIKPHTDFHGDVESGIMKMIVIGMGKKDGATACHSFTSRFSYDQIILSVGRKILATGKILFGVAALENAYHECAEIAVIPAQQIEAQEKILLPRAKALMPSLPVQQADLLLIDRIGKNISGAGMDPNITGRWFGVKERRQEIPDITRIMVRDLTDVTQGNAVGIGLADFCTRRVIDKMDRTITYLNSITSRNIIPAYIPLYFDTDQEALTQSFRSLGELIPPQQARMLWIQDTLNLDRLYASEALIPELQTHPGIASLSEFRELEFDATGNLIPVWKPRH